MSSPPKSGTEEDNDVILFMDELPSTNGFSLPALLDSDEHEVTETFPSIVAESVEKVEATGRRTPLSRLLETDNTNNPRPEHGPEIDDLEPELPDRREYYPGIDDGLLPDADDEKPPMLHDDTLDDALDQYSPTDIFFTSQGPSPRPGEYPTFPGFVPPTGASPPPDMNVYQQKKTIAQGMMDLALISANANQFRYVLQSSGRHPYYYPSLAMIGLSLFLQVVVGIGLIWNSRYNVKVDDQMCKANRANNWTVIAIFLVTILNVFISSFGVVEASESIFASSGST